MEREHHTSTHFWRVCVLGPLLAALLTGCGLFRPADNGPTPVKAQKVVHTAYSQMGKKYRLGGASPQKGFDCSGLIWWAYRQNGLNVPRITVDQARAGQSVPKIWPVPATLWFSAPGKARAVCIPAFTPAATLLSTVRAGASACAWKA